MKTLILTTAALATLVTLGAANAADMAAPPPVYKAPAPPPAYNWTGCYIGGGGGYGMWSQDSFLTAPGGTTVTGNTTNGGRGWFGMAQGGCDYQFGLPIFGMSQIVVGAFGDYNFDDLTGTLNTGGIFGNEKESGAWAVGGRAGILITPKFLSYFDGGYTQARFDQVNFVSDVAPVGAATGTSIAATTYNGWFLGSGFEYSFDFLPLPGLFLKTEYRYSSFDWTNVPLAGPGAAGFNIDSRKYTQTISTELIWRFNWFGH